MKSTEAALVPLVFVDDALATEPDQGGEKSAHVGYRGVVNSNISSPEEQDVRECVLQVRGEEVKG